MTGLYEPIMKLEYGRLAFEWLIVDDGSTEDISKAIKVAENKHGAGLNMLIISQEDGGIHIAQNTAEMLVVFFVTRIDIDDRLLSNVLKVRDFLRESIENEERFAGAVGICLHPDNIPWSSLSPQDVVDGTGAEARKRFNAAGDRNFCMRTEIMRKHYLPEHCDTKYMPEGSIWRGVDKNYLARFSNASIVVCANDSSDSMLLQPVSEKKTKVSALSSCHGSYHLLSECLGMMEFFEIV